MRRLLLMLAFGAGLYAIRGRLADVLTKTTGTWVGTPDQ